MKLIVRWVALIAASALVVSACGGDSDEGDVAGADGVASGAESEAGVAAPENVFDSDFHAVCDGVGVEVGTAFTSTPGEISPVVVLVDEGDFIVARSSAVRAGWERVWTEAEPLAMNEIELVACAVRTSATRVQECTGYQVDGVDSGNVVHLNEATYDVTLYEATTGAEVDATSFTFLDTACPTFVSFSEGETERDWYSFDDAPVHDFLAPHVAPA